MTPTYRRLNVSLTPKQHNGLKERSYDSNLSIAELIRRAVDRLLSSKAKP